MADIDEVAAIANSDSVSQGKDGGGACASSQDLSLRLVLHKPLPLLMR